MAEVLALDKKLILGLLFILLAALSSGCAGSIVETDNIQERLDTAAPLIAGSQTVGQTFVSHYSRLSAVELLLVVYPDSGEEGFPRSPPAAPRHLTFHLRSDPQDETDIVTLTVDTSNWKHNDPYRFSLPPQADSEGETYYFLLDAMEGNRTTVWHSSLDAYGEGTLYLNGQPGEGDLHFKTYYDYNLASMARDVWRGLLGGAWLIFPLLALFTLPGYLLHSLMPFESELDPLEHLALAVGLSLALAPLGLLLCSALGIALNGTRVLIAVVALSIGALWRLASTGFRDLRRWQSSTDRAFIVAFLFIFLVSLLVRFLHIRNLVVPAWIDSVHHTLITQLIVTQGGVPQSYEPLLPIGEFIYHFGFHSLVAAFHWLTGLDITRAMLIVGQVVNGLMVLSAYLLVKCLTGRRLAGLFGALIVGLISLMPAYYVSWGRYTQLTGLALLPTAIALTMKGVGTKTARRGLSNPRPPTSNPSARLRAGLQLPIAAVSVAGLLLTHYRVLILYGCFVLAYLLYETLTRSHGGTRRHGTSVFPCSPCFRVPKPSVPSATLRTGFLRYWGRAAMICLLAALLTLPWLVNLARALLPLATLPSRMQGAPSYNVAPYDLIMIGRNRGLIALSTCGFLWGLYKRERAVILTALWVALAVLITNPTILGFSSTWLINNASLAIALFVPFAILGGYLLASLQPPTFNPSTRLRAGLKRLILAVIIALVALWGAGGMLSVVNPSTVLATRDDMAAMDWIRRHAPSDARFLINVRHWQGGTHVGSDGGYWIPLLTGRDTILPPAIYIYGSAEYVKGINDLAEEIIAIESFDEVEGRRSSRDFPRTRQLLDDNGVTHIYIGARGGSITPQMLGNPRVAHSSYYSPVYSNGAVWIFQLER